MTPDEVYRYASAIARRFKSEHFEDLVSEGVLEYYEDNDKGTLYNRMKRRMHDYLNIKLKGVSIPSSGIARQIARDEHTEATGNLGPDTLQALRMALHGAYIEYEDHLHTSTDMEGHLDTKNWCDALQDAMSVLDDRQKQIVTMLYKEGMTVREVGDFLGISHVRVSQIEEQALKSLKDEITFCYNPLTKSEI